jgi:hypothetical protein
MSLMRSAKLRSQAHLEFSVTETMPSITKVAEALQKSPSGDLAPFELAFGDTFFGHKKKNPEKSALFAKVMAGTKGHNRGEEIANAFDWTGFNGTIVDVS